MSFFYKKQQTLKASLRFFSITFNAVFLFFGNNEIKSIARAKASRETFLFSQSSSSITEWQFEFFITLRDIFCKTFFMALITFWLETMGRIRRRV
jgi:hypothetical protein